MNYLASETRYQSMQYRRSGRSGLKLPAVSLGLWHNFGGVDTFSNSRAMVLRAFDLEAVDYLLKPFDDERFERAIRRAKDIIRARRLVDLARDIGTTGPNAALPAAADDERITVHEGRRISWVNVADVEWIEAADYYAQVHALGQVHLVREPLQSFEERFGKKFLRVHRGALVCVARIQRLDRLEGGDLVVVLQSGARVTVSRSRRAGVLRELGVR